jgi:hypothetical protein
MDASKLNWGKITFAAACRENTGIAMCDSGRENGRGWQQPEIPEDAPEIRDWYKGCSACIQTSVFLTERMDILRKLQSEWQKWDAKQHDLDWFESGRHFMITKGYVRACRGNVYNTENDLSDVYVYEVWQKPGEETSSDWIYDDNAIAVLYIHTGADVRGGYGRPIFCRSKGDYAIPMDLCAEYHAEPAKPDVEINDVDWGHYQAIDEEWQTGYSSYPYGQLESDVETWHEETRTRDSVEVTLKTGERIRVRASAPYNGG